MKYSLTCHSQNVYIPCVFYFRQLFHSLVENRVALNESKLIEMRRIIARCDDVLYSSDLRSTLCKRMIKEHELLEKDREAKYTENGAALIITNFLRETEANLLKVRPGADKDRDDFEFIFKQQLGFTVRKTRISFSAL